MPHITQLTQTDRDMITPRRKGQKVAKGDRKGTLQGHILKVAPTEHIEHTGGGRRGSQWGHSANCETRVRGFLLTHKPPQYKIGLDFPGPVEPVKALKLAEKFTRRLAKAITFSAVQKLEPAPGRMGAELTILIWTEDLLDKATVQEIWNKVIRTPSTKEIHFEPVDTNRWVKLANYFSKKILIRPDMVTVGAKQYKVNKTDDGKEVVLEQISRKANAHINPQNSSNPISSKLFRKWLNYHGQFIRKINPELIPECTKHNIVIPETLDQSLRNEANSKRKEHFIIKGRAYTMII